ncbi:hypothetical protein MLD52_02025 [Puniceicoccaceae bacterium K14]|nr:hypothetical protein [Puniceicoccaceae bacterium K14]
MLEYLIPRASSYAGDIDRLFDVITYLVGFWFILTLGYFFYLVFRYRAKDGQKAEYITGETHKQKMAVEVPHYLILVCDAAIIILTFIVWHKVKIDKPEVDEEIRIVAQQWAWSFYHAGPDGVLGNDDDIPMVNELHVKKDVTYRFYLEATDVMHSFSVPVFRLKQDAIPGRIIEGWFQPTKTGEWDIQCAEMCGVAHGIMGARIFIETEEEHNEWMASVSELPSVNWVAKNEAKDLQEKEDKNNG